MERHDHERDVRELTELTYRYAYALDGRDWKAMAELFTEDCEFDYGLGPEHVMRGRDTFIEASAAALEAMDATHHMFTNHLFEIDGDTATGRWYMHAQHMKLGEPGGALHTLGGIYEDEFVRTPDGWKTSRRSYRAIWGRGNNRFNPGFRSDAP
jgi:ketosteroid isomerase-like protein